MIFYLSTCLCVTKLYSEIIQDCFGGEYDNSKIYFINIQGPTSSGKSSLASKLMNSLKDRNPFLLKLDDFYDFPDGKSENEKDLDFDHPKVLNWDNIFLVVKSLIERQSLIPVFKRSKEASNIMSYKSNNNYNIIIIEGLYAFNCLNDKIFDLDNLDNGLHHFKLNTISSNSILNIRLTQCKNKLYSLRIERDRINRNLSENDVRERLDKFIWPDTLKWVYSKNFKHDILIPHGNFNREVVDDLISRISEYFNCEKSSKFCGHVSDLSEFFQVECGSDCLQQNKLLNC